MTRILPALATLLLAFTILFPLPAQAQIMRQEELQEELQGPPTALRWQLDLHSSSITYNNPAVGNSPIPLKNFTADIHFDPRDLPGSRLELAVDASSLFLNAEDVNVELLEYIEPTTQIIPESPATAVFKSSTIRRQQSNSFVADGTLTVNSMQRPLSLPFTVTLTNPPGGGTYITLKGDITVNRMSFGGGPASLGPSEVPFTFNLVARLAQ